MRASNIHQSSVASKCQSAFKQFRILFGQNFHFWWERQTLEMNLINGKMSLSVFSFFSHGMQGYKTQKHTPWKHQIAALEVNVNLQPLAFTISENFTMLSFSEKDSGSILQNTSWEHFVPQFVARKLWNTFSLTRLWGGGLMGSVTKGELYVLYIYI